MNNNIVKYKILCNSFNKNIQQFYLTLLVYGMMLQKL